MVGMLLGIALSACLPTALDKIEGNLQAAQPVINALENHYNDFERYPNDIEALVPHYLDAIPTLAEEQKLRYTAAAKSYELYFEVDQDTACRYTSELERWDCSLTPGP